MHHRGAGGKPRPTCYGWRVNTARHPRSCAVHVKCSRSTTARVEAAGGGGGGSPAPGEMEMAENVILGWASSRIPVMSSGAEPTLYTAVLKKRSLEGSKPTRPCPCT